MVIGNESKDIDIFICLIAYASQVTFQFGPYNTSHINYYINSRLLPDIRYVRMVNTKGVSICIKLTLTIFFLLSPSPLHLYTYTHSQQRQSPLLFFFLSSLHNGASTAPKTSSITSSAPTPSSRAATAARSLPHCMLRSRSTLPRTRIRCRYALRTARPTRAGVA